MKRIFFSLLMCATITIASAQTNDQAKQFINKGQQAILKAQKEMIRTSDNAEETSLRKAVRYQAVAVKLFNSNKTKEALDFAFKARTQAIGLLEKLNKAAVNYFLPSDEEKGYISTDYSRLSSDESILTDAESDKIDHVNIMDPGKVMELELTVNK